MIQLVTQTPEERCCGQCVVAMALGIGRDCVIDLVGHARRTRPADLRRVLEAHGRQLLPSVRLKKARDEREQPEFPKLAILREHIEVNGKRHTHWMLWGDGKIWCPNIGIVQGQSVNWMAATDPSHPLNQDAKAKTWITSYLEVR